MLKYIIISESNHCGWLCDYVKLSEGKKLLKQEDIVVYIFKIEYKNKMDIVKLNYPFNQYYSCLEINNINILYNIIEDEDDEHVEIHLMKKPIIKFVN